MRRKGDVCSIPGPARAGYTTTMNGSPAYLGVEIGGTKLQVARGRADGSVHELLRETAQSTAGAESIAAQVIGMIGQLQRDHTFAGVGIGFGGPVDEDTGVVITSHQVAGWDRFPLCQRILDATGLRARLANDTDLATLAEATCGAGRGGQCVFYTNIGSGIGGGLVRGGQLYSAPHGAMEFGHTWSYSHQLSRWDRLEHLCSGWSIARRAQEQMRLDPQGDLARRCRHDPQQIDAPLVTDAWLAGDRWATSIMADVLESLARGLANVIALLNPDRVVIGGGLSLVGPPLLQAIRERVDEYVFAPFAQNYSIHLAELGERSVPVGGLLWGAR